MLSDLIYWTDYRGLSIPDHSSGLKQITSQRDQNEIITKCRRHRQLMELRRIALATRQFLTQ